jgi:hypothetical protein
MANIPDTMPTIARTNAATGCHVWEKCIIVALPLIPVAMAAVVSLSKFFIMGMVVVLLQILWVVLILALMIRQK